MENSCVGNDVKAATPGKPQNWHSIDWKLVMQFVGKAQQQIAKAEMDKDFRRVRRLQRSLVRSWQAKVRISEERDRPFRHRDRRIRERDRSFR
jgi:RNA-directed DNA polymerase